MRAADTYTESLFTVKKLEDFIPQNQPLRPPKFDTKCRKASICIGHRSSTPNVVKH